MIYCNFEFLFFFFAAAHGAQQEVALKNTSSVGGSTTADLGRFLVQDDSSQENENIRGMYCTVLRHNLKACCH